MLTTLEKYKISVRDKILLILSNLCDFNYSWDNTKKSIRNTYAN